MFKVSLLAVATLFVASASFAGDGGGSDGCGLGWQVTQKKSFLATTTRATTNGVVPPTFGMTSGTIGCDQHSFAKKDIDAANYIASNHDPLMMDLAKGHGEYLDSFAKVLGCKDASKLGAATRAHFSDISAGATTSQVLNSTKEVVKSDASLAASCEVI